MTVTPVAKLPQASRRARRSNPAIEFLPLPHVDGLLRGGQQCQHRRLAEKRGGIGAAAGCPQRADPAGRDRLAAGADDVRQTDTAPPAFDVLCPPSDLHTVKAALAAAGLPVGEASLDMLPSSTVPVSGDAAKTLLELLDALEDNDDVKKVFTNADIDEAALATEE